MIQLPPNFSSQSLKTLITCGVLLAEMYVNRHHHNTKDCLKTSIFKVNEQIRRTSYYTRLQQMLRSRIEAIIEVDGDFTELNY